jgi:hypothetical protein
MSHPTPLTEIQITSTQSLEQWEILEMQGALEARTPTGTLENIILGQLTLNAKLPTEKQRRAELVIGKQSCDGKQIEIKKPLLVLKKTHNSKTGEVEYEVAAIVRDKILFRNRPVPLSPSSRSPTSSPNKMEIERSPQSKKKPSIFDKKKKETPGKENEIQESSPIKPTKLAFEQLFAPKKKKGN